MKNYNPSITWGVHTVEVALQQWGYVGHLKLKNTGNCRGKDVLDFDFECLIGAEIDNDCNFQYHEGDASEFNGMIVKTEIIDYVEKRD